MKAKGIIVEELFSKYQRNGYITEDDIYNACDENDLSIFDTDYVVNKIYDLGVLVTSTIENTSKTETVSEKKITDYSQIDYEIVYQYFDKNFPGMKSILSIARNTPPIQHGEMNSLITQFRSGNNHAKEIAFKKYIRLALKTSYNYKDKTSLPIEDIFQEACLGIIMAIESYNPYINSAFTSYCSTWIMQRVERYIADHESFIRIPIHEHEKTINIMRKIDFEEPDSDNYMLQEIQKIFNATYEKSIKILNMYRMHHNIFLEEMYEDCNDIPLIDVNSNVESIVYSKLLRTQIEKVLKTLSEKEEKIIRMRFGFDNGYEMTFEEIAKHFGLSKQRIRQIEAEALRKIKHPTVSKYLKGYL